MGKKLTNEEFIRRVYENNKYVKNGDIEIIGEYLGVEKSIEYLCHRCNSIRNPVALSLLMGNGCNICGKISSSQKQRKSNQRFQAELQQLRNNGKDVYSDDEYINNRRKISFYCSNGHTWDTAPANILKGNGCPYCSNKLVWVGFNDIATTSPDIFQYLANVEDGYKYVRWSNKRVDFKCTLCGHIQNRKIASVAHRGFKCECCGNGMSYPNKFGRSFFEQLPVDYYKPEYRPKWGSPYIYDIYFKYNGKEYLVEWDGARHFRNNGAFGIPLAERQIIDSNKNKLAKENNICLIRIDCSKSECNYIRRNIQSSDLGVMFDLSNINWDLCDELAQANTIKLACDLWMSGMKSFEELSNRLCLSNSTVRDYINKGVRLGWCDYDSKKWIETQSKSIRVISISDKKEYLFDSIKMCSAGMINLCGHKVAAATIVKYCENGHEYNGFLFQYIE